MQTQQHKFVNWQCDLEYRGEDFTAAVTLGNPDVVVGSGTSFPFWGRVSVTGAGRSYRQRLQVLTHNRGVDGALPLFDQASW